MTKQIPELNEALARKVLETVDHGLVKGLGTAKPGQMCVEAAVCYAYGIPHNDNPPCVGSAVRAFKIALNDQQWASNAARAEGMRGVAIGQLGSNVLDQKEFARRLAKKIIQKLLPKIFRLIAGMTLLSVHQTSLLAAADRCELEGTQAAAHAAAYAAYAAHAAAYAAYAADAAAIYAAAAYAANAAAAYAAKDEWRKLAAELCLEVLKEMKSPGCEYLYLLDETKGS